MQKADFILLRTQGKCYVREGVNHLENCGKYRGTSPIHPFHVLRKGISPIHLLLFPNNRSLHPAPQRKQGKGLPRPTAKLRSPRIRKSSQSSRKQRYDHSPARSPITISSAHLHVPLSFSSPLRPDLKPCLLYASPPLRASRSLSLSARKTQIRRPRDPFPRQPARPGDPDRLSDRAAGEGVGRDGQEAWKYDRVCTGGDGEVLSLSS